MVENSRRDDEKEARWRILLARQAASGQTIAEWCRRHRISDSLFHYWRRVIADRDRDSGGPACETAAVSADRQAAGGGVEIVLADSRVVRVGAGFDAPTLRRVLAATAQATGEGYVRVDWGGSFNIRHAQLHPDAPPPRFECSHGRTALDLILACGGSAYLPEPMVAPLLAAGRLHPVEGAKPISREVYATYRTDHRHAETLARLSRRSKAKARG